MLCMSPLSNDDVNFVIHSSVHEIEGAKPFK